MQWLANHPTCTVYVYGSVGKPLASCSNNGLRLPTAVSHYYDQNTNLASIYFVTCEQYCTKYTVTYFTTYMYTMQTLFSSKMREGGVAVTCIALGAWSRTTPVTAFRVTLHTLHTVEIYMYHRGTTLLQP